MSREPRRSHPVAVIGMAGRFAGAGDIAQYWKNLLDGVESISRTDRTADERPVSDGAGDGRFVPAVGKVSHVDRFAADHFRVPPAEAVTMDPQQRILLEVAAEALDDAGYAGDRDAVVGVFVGCGENLYYRDFVAPTESSAGRLGDVRVTLANEKDFLAPRLAFKLGFTGPAITVQTGCATSLSAVALACSALAAGECDIALAGGVSLLPPDTHGYTYHKGGILSADGYCRPFDVGASGAVPSSGAGIVVLRRDDDARAARDNRRAVILGWAVNNDGGARAGFSAPNVDGQEAVIRAALGRAGLAPRQVGYVETHGTGTAIGDMVEFEALRRVFAGDDAPAGTVTLGAVKANIGHADAASGVAGLIKATLAVESGTLPGTAHFRAPNPELGMGSTPFGMTADTRPWQPDGPRVAGVSSFGLGGSNAHVIVGTAAPAPAVATTKPRSVLALSARTGEELHRMRERLAERLETMTPDDSVELADVAYTLAVGRGRFTRRWSAVVSSRADAIAKLRAPQQTGRAAARWSLAIAGTPGDLAELGKRLQEAEPVMRSSLVRLTGSAELSGLPTERAGALTAAVVGWILQRLGLTFARVDAQDWARPVAQWLAGGADIAALAPALDACTGTAGGRDARHSPGNVVIGPSFDLDEVLAMAWQAGAGIDWATYYADEPRRRVSLPAYPFTRQRFWLDRPVVTSGGSAGGSTGRNGVDIVNYVGQVWRDVLGVEHIPLDAHFSDDLGGDSMYAVEVAARLREGLGLDLPVDLPFVAPTVAASAAFVEEASAKKETAS
ncbi:beta-ketoacyl synthase N-terminal-like domain-containing protein [Micromonospora cathayae]|uniref:Beta-ketoacyl synthase N-terminal-like domain-containing protein n=1 Tax=Micromonospora cathayae TaxID=3028804 RepID=A0ABY7ZTL0_9ACTN|nr:beta-ketoacyl synthase N-terminal-like domain-containing protein [Micromonospora sp. HUAS 3]WDZ86235.1 beta-ketoacyl synthase N-terminal-like domain-containing protein [Micromonospora sp. HUAS 3]